MRHCNFPYCLRINIDWRFRLQFVVLFQIPLLFIDFFDGWSRCFCFLKVACFVSFLEKRRLFRTRYNFFSSLKYSTIKLFVWYWLPILFNFFKNWNIWDRFLEHHFLERHFFKLGKIRKLKFKIINPNNSLVLGFLSCYLPYNTEILFTLLYT